MNEAHVCHISVHLLAAAEVHGAVLHLIQAVQALAGAVGDAGDGVIGHIGLDAGVGLDELVKAPNQAAAAGHDDTVGGDVCHQLGGRTLQRGVYGVEDRVDRIGQCLTDLLRSDGDVLGQTVHQVAALDLHGAFLFLGESGTDLDLHILGGSFTD